MVEPIYCLKPAWCGRHLAGLRPETGLTVRYGATAFKAVGCHSDANRFRMILKSLVPEAAGVLMTDRARPPSEGSSTSNSQGPTGTRWAKPDASPSTGHDRNRRPGRYWDVRCHELFSC